MHSALQHLSRATSVSRPHTSLQVFAHHANASHLPALVLHTAGNSAKPAPIHSYSCLKHATLRSKLSHIAPSSALRSAVRILSRGAQSSADDDTSSLTMISAICIAVAAFILLLAGALLGILWRRHRKKAALSVSQSGRHGGKPLQLRGGAHAVL